MAGYFREIDENILEENIEEKQRDLSNLLKYMDLDAHIPEINNFNEPAIMFGNPFKEDIFYRELLTQHEKSVEFNKPKKRYDKNFNNKSHQKFFKKNFYRSRSTLNTEINFIHDEIAEFSIRGLQIGPEFEVQSDIKNLLNKFEDCCFCLTELSTERFIIEKEIFNGHLKTIPVQSNNYVLEEDKQINIKFIYEFTFLAAANECCNVTQIVHFLLKILNTFEDISKIDCERKITDEYMYFVENLRSMRDLSILSQQTNNLNHDEVNLLIDAIESVTDIVKCMHTYIWSLKNLIQNKNIDLNQLRERFSGA